jgi:hypothetical protein
MEVRWRYVKVYKGLVIVQPGEEVRIVFLPEGSESRHIHVIIVIVRNHNNVNFRNIFDGAWRSYDVLV